MSDVPRYATLRDYLQVLRTHGLLIALVTLTFAGAAYGLSSRQDKVYRAETALAFQDPIRQLEYFGSTPGQAQQSADQRAAIKAELVTRPALLEQVGKALDPPASVDSLQSRVTARPEARTNLVIVEARARTPERAADIANEVARRTVRTEGRREERKFEAAARSLARSLRRARRRQEGGNEFVRALAEERISRLEALRDFAVPVEISRRAEVPKRSVSPRPVRNTIFGGLLGLALGILAAFARDALDRRFRTPRDIEKELGLPLLGRVSDKALRQPFGPGDPADSSEADSFQILRANLEFLDPQRVAKTVAVTSAVAGEGKSTVAASLAAASAAVGRRTLLVECDLRRPSLAENMGLKRGPGLSDYLMAQASSTEILQAVALGEGSRNGDRPGEDGDASNLTCIVAGTNSVLPAEMLGSNRFQDFLAVLSRSYDSVILDCGPLLPVVDTLALLPFVDAVLLCVRVSHTTRDQARGATAALGRLPERPAGLVVTGIPSGQTSEYGSYYHSTPDAPAKVEARS